MSANRLIPMWALLRNAAALLSHVRPYKRTFLSLLSFAEIPMRPQVGSWFASEIRWNRSGVLQAALGSIYSIYIGADSLDSPK